MKTWRVKYHFLDEERDVIVRADGYVQSRDHINFYTRQPDLLDDDRFTAHIPNVIRIAEISENPIEL